MNREKAYLGKEPVQLHNSPEGEFSSINFECQTWVLGLQDGLDTGPVFRVLDAG